MRNCVKYGKKMMIVSILDGIYGSVSGLLNFRSTVDFANASDNKTMDNGNKLVAKISTKTHDTRNTARSITDFGQS